MATELLEVLEHRGELLELEVPLRLRSGDQLVYLVDRDPRTGLAVSGLVQVWCPILRLVVGESGLVPPHGCY